MKCAVHGVSDAIASCRGCQKGLCQRCVDRFNETLCQDCLLHKVDKEAKQLYWGLACTLLFFGVGFYAWFSVLHGFFTTAIIVGLLMAGAYWGWLFLNRHLFTLARKTRTFGRKIAVLLGYYLLKFGLSIAIGIFVGPYEILRIIRGILQVKKIKASAHKP